MAYIHIPVDFDAPTEADFDLFRAALERVGDASVHVHCIVNARVSAFIYKFRLSLPDFSKARARQDLERIWRPGGVWAAFLGNETSIDLPHRPGRRSD